MQNFMDIRFPADIAYGVSGGPEYFTDIVTAVSGKEYRNINWQKPRAKYKLSHAIKTKEQLEKLINFFRITKGQAIGFRFKDFTDYDAYGQIIGSADGKNKKFQLKKIYYNGFQDETRIITKPVEGTVTIYLNNKKIQNDVMINYTTGEIVFASPPVSGTKISADFEFDVPVRFNSDFLCASINDYNSYSWDDIELIEIK